MQAISGRPVLALGSVALAAASLLVYRHLKHLSRSRGLPYPPGPAGKPLIGNVLDLPSKEESAAFAALADTYGDVVHLEALGNHIIILSSVAAVEELLEKRSATTSDRIVMPMSSELMGWNRTIGLAAYTDYWRSLRRAGHPFLHTQAVVQWQPQQLRETRLFLQRLLESSDDIFGKMRSYIACSVMASAYGLHVTGSDDAYIVAHQKALSMLVAATLPGAYLVDIFPLLKYVPQWFPGAGFQRYAAEGKRQLSIAIDQPWKAVKEARANGTAEPSIALRMMEELNPEQEGTMDEFVIQNACGGFFAAGAETSESTILIFILAMLRYPDIQVKAHAELDAVIGTDRLPEFSDAAHLPYIDAIVSETLRWQPITPLAIPHASIQDEVYNGYFIPKGSIIMGHVWMMLHNPEDYPEPEEFRPERYVRPCGDGSWKPDQSVRNPRTIAFGFGRRICQGMHLAEQQLFIAIASLLAAFDILPVTDADGKPVIPPVNMSSGMTSHPAKFECRMRPRSEQAKRFIQLGD